jgi:protein-disulfide isomerase
MMQELRTLWRVMRAVMDTLATLGVIAVSVVLVRYAFVSGVVPSAQSRIQTRSLQQESLPTTTVSLDGMAITGAHDAHAVVIEFSDFQCPFCGRFARDTLPEFKRKFVDTGQVELAFSPFPLTSIHPLAMRAAELAYCSGQQGMFWKIHDDLFAGPESITATLLDSIERDVALDRTRLSNCLEGSSPAAVASMMSRAKALGVTSTPTFFIGIKEKGGVRVKQRITGAVPIDRFAVALGPLVEAAQARAQGNG